MKIYNSLTKQIEEFISIEDKKVKMYVCGITPYDTTHLGHAFTYVFFDVLYRYLTYKGYKVTYTQNVTDINDRNSDILQRALEQHTSWQNLSNFWTKRFLEDMDALNWQKPTYYLRASEQINSMITLVQTLLNNGYAYQKESFVFLNIKKIKNFGKLSKLSEKQMMEKAKEFEEDIDNPLKINKLDITLWRGAILDRPTHIPSFDSPFGKGRPGWHLECSAMAISSLVEQIDIHGGGLDLIYPHHESEIAQSESATEKIPFAKYWLHTGTVMYQGKKMSKSLGNLVLVKDLLKKYSANSVRYLLLSHHYRKPWEFIESEFNSVEISLDKIYRALSFYNPKENISPNNEMLALFKSYMKEDINIPKSLNHLTELAEKITNEKNNLKKNKMLWALLCTSFSMLGFSLK